MKTANRAPAASRANPVLSIGAYRSASMDIAGGYHDLIETALRLSGASDTMLHVHSGLLIYVVAQYLLRTRRASVHALMAVAGLELANELMDALHFGALRPADTLKDIATTLAWPLVLYLLAGHRRRRWRRAAASRVPRGGDVLMLRAVRPPGSTPRGASRASAA